MRPALHGKTPNVIEASRTQDNQYDVFVIAVFINEDIHEMMFFSCKIP